MERGIQRLVEGEERQSEIKGVERVREMMRIGRRKEKFFSRKGNKERRKKE